MRLNELRTHLVRCIRAGISAELISSPGLGKSEFVADTVQYLSEVDGEEWGLKTYMLATATPPDFTGYIMKKEIEWEGQQVSISDPTMPNWMVIRDPKTGRKRPMWGYKKGVLFLDEFGQGEADVKRCSGSLLLSRCIGDWYMPAEWVVIAASNQSTDRSGVTKSFDFLINRRMEFHITADLGSWVEWATKRGNISHVTIAFANQHPNIVFSGTIPAKQGPWCTPRSLVMLDKILQMAAEGNGGKIPHDATTQEAAMGLIGDAATSYFNFVRLDKEMPTIEEIVANPDKVKVPTEADAQMLICYNLAHRTDESNVEPIIRYVDRFNKEFSVTYAKAACQRLPLLVITPAFNRWAKQNSALMALITK